MKVIIAGGGIAGLTMAAALERAGIDFVLLEARSLFDPQVGASIGLHASAMRVFDQIGAVEEIMDQTTPIKRTKNHRKDGSLFMSPMTSMPILRKRFGYDVSFLDRQLVLRALAKTIESKDRMLLNKKVKSIDHQDEGVVVHCEDGTHYGGDIVIGCDGVRSKVRQEMWRIASESDPDYFPEKERQKMTAEYSCLFGISDPVEGFDEGDIDYTYDRDASFLIITGKNRRIYWFYFEKLDKIYTVTEPDFPRYTRDDAIRHAEKNSWRPVNEKNQTLKDIWEKRVTFTFVPMEEALFEKWSWGRIATIGDCAHKMTANHGQAGNNAVESAAALANQLKRLQDRGSTSVEDISTAFKQWQDKRKARIEATVGEAAGICRMQALASFKDYLIVFWMLPIAKDMLNNKLTDVLIGAEMLEYLPVPERSFDANCPYNPKQGVGFKESLTKRALFATPLLLLSCYSFLTTSTGQETLSRLNTLTNPTTASTTSWLAANTQVADMHLLYALWFIESVRRVNILTLAQLAPYIMALAQAFGPAVIAPLFYYIYYIFTPVEKFAPSDLRLTNVAYTRTIMPLMLFITAQILAQRYFHYDLGTSPKQSWWLSVSMPVLVRGMQWILVKMGVSTTDEQHDAEFEPKKDLPAIRRTAYILSAIATISWWTAIYHNAISLTDRSHSLFLASTALWLGFLFGDTKRAGMGARSWLRFVGESLVLGAVAGPAAALGLVWLQREETLASKRHRDAVTREKYGGKSFDEVASGLVRKAGDLVQGNGSVSRHVKGLSGFGK